MGLAPQVDSAHESFPVCPDLSSLRALAALALSRPLQLRCKSWRSRRRSKAFAFQVRFWSFVCAKKVTKQSASWRSGNQVYVGTAVGNLFQSWAECGRAKHWEQLSWLMQVWTPFTSWCRGQGTTDDAAVRRWSNCFRTWELFKLGLYDFPQEDL